MSTLSEPPVWPLPAGHFYGPSELEAANAACHSGDTNWVDNAKLRLWQQHYREVWDHDFEVSGVVDAHTQDAVEAVQDAAGFEPTGKLDANTWTACWEAKPPSKAETHPKTKKPTTRSAFKEPMGRS